eukprot:COSAG05_NODE_2747_length_2692_cov_3.072889_3_plen_133_part_00
MYYSCSTVVHRKSILVWCNSFDIIEVYDRGRNLQSTNTKSHNRTHLQARKTRTLRAHETSSTTDGVLYHVHVHECHISTCYMYRTFPGENDTLNIVVIYTRPLVCPEGLADYYVSRTDTSCSIDSMVRSLYY